MALIFNSDKVYNKVETTGEIAKKADKNVVKEFQKMICSKD